MQGRDTQSVCPVCLRSIPARRVEEKEKIYLEKQCPDHGPFRTLIWEGAPDYWTWGGERPPTRPVTIEGVRDGCPHDCGICGAHRQRACCVLLEVTQRCDLGCPVCFADAGGQGDDPDMDTVARWYDVLCRDAKGANIQLSGGEPTIRDDLSEIIRLGREKGFTFFQLNTNGLRLAREPEYVRRLKRAGLSCVFLQFDGVTDGVYEILRGRPLLEEKIKAVENCKMAGLGVVLVPVVAPEINLDQVGAIIDFALERLPYVRGIHFQPMTYFGRYDIGDRGRLTLPRLMRQIEAQTNGRIRCAVFSGGTAEHSHCSFSGNFLLKEDGAVQALRLPESENSDHDGSCCCGPEAFTAVEHARKTVAARWGGLIPTEEPAPADSDSLDAALYELSHRRFSISAMAFQDCWSLDIDRLRSCYIHVLSPNGRLLPFCAYNLTSADRRPLYRRTI